MLPLHLFPRNDRAYQQIMTSSPARKISVSTCVTGRKKQTFRSSKQHFEQQGWQVAMIAPLGKLNRHTSGDFEALKSRIHGRLVEKLDMTRVSELEGDSLRRDIRVVVEHLCDTESTMLNRSEGERLIEEVLNDAFGFGPLELPIKEDDVADIMINGPKNVFLEKNAAFSDQM